MTRRNFLLSASAATASLHADSRPPSPLIVPVNVVVDRQVKWRPEVLAAFWSNIWPQAVTDLGRAGIRLQNTSGAGDVFRPPYRQPILTGLEHGVINLVITYQIPFAWDRGSGWNGVTTLYRGYHVCMVALSHAHRNEIPLVSINTCLHELLHALLLDIFDARPTRWDARLREFRIDWYGTRLWLFHDGAAVRQSAQRYVQLLRAH